MTTDTLHAGSAFGERAAVSPVRRLGALIIDVLASIGVLVSLFFSLVVVAAVVGTSSAFDEAYLVPAIMLGGPLLMLLLPVVLMARRGDANGQTLGKQALGLRVVREDGVPVGFGIALVREGVGKVLLGATLLWLVVDAAVALADASGRSLHDRLATTRVVPADPAAS